MSFFNARFFSAFEKVARVCALFLNALFACIYGQIPLSCTVYMILFSKCLFLQMLSKLLRYSVIRKNIIQRFKFVVKNVRGFKSCGILTPVGVPP